MFQFSINAGTLAEPVQPVETKNAGNMKPMNTDNMKSVELLYTIAQNEYSNEHERTNMLHSKAGIALPIISAYFLALIQMNDYKSMWAFPVADIWTAFVPVALFISYTAGAVFALLSVVYMAKVVFAKGYMRIDPENLWTKDNLTLEHQDFMEKLMKIYFKAIEFNINVNNDRMKTYKKSWMYTFYSVLCFVIYIVLKNNI